MISERNYQGFKQDYKKAFELYRTEGTEDPEMPLLEKVYEELEKADWL